METQETETQEIWSNEKKIKVEFLENYLKDQIKVRYAMYERPISGLNNIVIDSFIPRLFVASEMKESLAKSRADFPQTAVTINPWFSDIFGVKKIETEQLCRILGYDKKYLKDLFRKVKDLQWSISFIGLGGSSSNTIHWLTEIAKMTNTINLFDKVNSYENDNFDITNLFRIPKNPNSYTNQNSIETTKFKIVENDINYLSKKKSYNKRIYFSADNLLYIKSKDSLMRANLKYIDLAEEELERVRRGLYVRRRIVKDENGNRILKVSHTKKRHVLYGAPDIDTREKLSNVFSHFVSATHGGNDWCLVLNPEQNSSLQVESYGMIQLAQFFMNQLHMAISFMEFLATDPDLDEKNKMIAEGSFNGERKLKCDREYNFQLNFNGRMMDENQINNI